MANAGASLSIRTDLVQYRPGEVASITVEAEDLSPGAADRVVLDIVHLTETVATMEKSVEQEDEGSAGRWTFRWTAPGRKAGYGLVARLVRDGETVVRAESALDVSGSWTEQPRYGFISEFDDWDEERERAAFRKINRLHLNGLQFYDWMYRHDQLIPPTDTFVDSLGRRLTVEAIEGKIRLSREHGIAPMAYTAIYAASPEFRREHPEWGLYNRDGSPMDFGDGYLYLMDPSRGSGWHDHLIEEFVKVLQGFDFEGIHVDQYGYPKVAYDKEGRAIQMAPAFRHFLDDAKEALVSRFERNSLTFNSVTNWPAAIVARSAYDFNYVEVWPPYETYGDLELILVDAYRNSGGKATVIAAYVNPEDEATVRLLNAFIFAHGGTHIEMGEGDGMLSDPYFPKFRRVSDSLWTALVRSYDFIVRYKEWLYGPRERLRADDRVRVDGEPVFYRPQAGQVHAVLYKATEVPRHVLSLINLTAAESEKWKERQPEPQTLTDLHVTVELDEAPSRVYWASPDRGTGEATSLSFSVAEDQDGRVLVDLEVPSLEYWSIVAFE